MEDNKPPILNSKNIALITKIIAIYAGFYRCVIIVQLLTNPLSDNPLRPENSYDPVYFMAAIHVLVLVICGASVWFKKFHWAVTLVCALIVTLSRFYYNEISEYIWSMSSTV